LHLFPLFYPPVFRWGYDPPTRRFFQVHPGVKTQKTPLFIVTAVKTSNLTSVKVFPLLN
jgi:hypothetical protein